MQPSKNPKKVLPSPGKAMIAGINNANVELEPIYYNHSYRCGHCNNGPYGPSSVTRHFLVCEKAQLLRYDAGVTEHEIKKNINEKKNATNAAQRKYRNTIRGKISAYCSRAKARWCLNNPPPEEKPALLTIFPNDSYSWHPLYWRTSDIGYYNEQDLKAYREILIGFFVSEMPRSIFSQRDLKHLLKRIHPDKFQNKTEGMKSLTNTVVQRINAFKAMLSQNSLDVYLVHDDEYTRGQLEYYISKTTGAHYADFNFSEISTLVDQDLCDALGLASRNSYEAKLDEYNKKCAEYVSKIKEQKASDILYEAETIQLADRMRAQVAANVKATSERLKAKSPKRKVDTISIDSDNDSDSDIEEVKKPKAKTIVHDEFQDYRNYEDTDSIMSSGIDECDY